MKSNFIDIILKFFIILPFIIMTLPIFYLAICFANENIFGWGKNINYCVIEPTNKTGTLYSDEYKLVGIRRWQVTNSVLGIYSSASDAFDASKVFNCPVDR